MNLQSILLLGAILVVALIVLVRYIRRPKRCGGSCGSCQCNCEADRCHN
ncbi:MAG: FeoB-associated Cys-rich membrane protein [Bacteroidaceae bacterium]|nr:FeoB-associated Cys-rich membrane protein [Bacteroidaceae bacterium]